MPSFADTAPVQETGGMASMRGLWSIPAWRGLLLAQTLRQMGTFAMLSLLAVRLWTDDSPLAAGAATGAFFLAGAIAPWLVGALSDHIGRRALLVLTGLAEALLLLALGTMLLTSSPVTVLLLTSAALGVVDACNAPLFGPATIEAVPTGDQEKAAAAMGFAYDGGKVLGAAVAGAGLWLNPSITAMLAAAAASTAVVLVARHAPSARPIDTASHASRTEPWYAPWRAVAVPVAALVAMSTLGGQTTLLIASLVRPNEPIQYVAAILAFSVGAVTGTALVVRQRTVILRHMGIGLAGLGLALTAASVAPAATTSAVLCLLVYGVATGYVWQAAWPLILLPVPSARRGSVTGGMQLALQLAQAGGALVFAWLAMQAAPGPIVYAAGMCLLTSVAVLLAARRG